MASLASPRRCNHIADRVETLFPAALVIAIGNELLSEVPEAAISVCEDLFNAVMLDNVLDWTS